MADVDEEKESESLSEMGKPKRRMLAKMPTVNFSKKSKKRTLGESEESDAKNIEVTPISPRREERAAKRVRRDESLPSLTPRSFFKRTLSMASFNLDQNKRSTLILSI